MSSDDRVASEAAPLGDPSLPAVLTVDELAALLRLNRLTATERAADQNTAG